MADNPDPQGLYEPSLLAQFRGLPLSEIIAAPLSAASDAQVMLARSTVEFIDTVGLNPPAKDGSGERTARQIQFSVTRPLPQASGAIREERVELGVPLLALVATPNLQVQSVSVDFEMRIKSSALLQQEDRFAGRTDIDSPGSPAPAPGTTASAANQPAPRPRVYLHGEVASQRAQTRKSDNSARLRVHVVAGQAPAPEGLSRVLDILATACAPRAITAAGSPGPAAPAALAGRNPSAGNAR